MPAKGKAVRHFLPIAAAAFAWALGKSPATALSHAACAFAAHAASPGFVWAQAKAVVRHLPRLFSFAAASVAPDFFNAFWQLASAFPTPLGSPTPPRPLPPRFTRHEPARVGTGTSAASWPARGIATPNASSARHSCCAPTQAATLATSASVVPQSLWHSFASAWYPRPSSFVRSARLVHFLAIAAASLVRARGALVVISAVHVASAFVRQAGTAGFSCTHAKSAS